MGAVLAILSNARKRFASAVICAARRHNEPAIKSSVDERCGECENVFKAACVPQKLYKDRPILIKI